MKNDHNHRNISAFYSLIFFIVISCSSGSSDSIPITNLGGKINAAGYPDVAGNYSFNTDTLTYTCAKGASGTIPPLTATYLITQTKNQLSGKNSSPPAGMTFTEDSNMNGTIEVAGKFIMDQNATATIASVPGSNTIKYTLVGHFYFSGWAGDYTYTVLNSDSNDTCTYKTTFTGDYVSAIAPDTSNH
jgi:hypothetical protein